MARSLKIDLASFQEMKSFSQFGSDLDASTVSILKHGEVLMQVLRQEQYAPRSLARQVFELYLAKSKKLDSLDISLVRKTINECYEYTNNTYPNIFVDIMKNKELTGESESSLRQAIEEYFLSKEKENE